MKKLLGFLLVLALVCAGLVYSGTVTTDQLRLWGNEAIDWTLNAAADLIGTLQEKRASTGQKDVLLVNASHPLPEGYQAENLISLYEQPRSFSLSHSDMRLSQEPFEAAERMFAAAKAAGQSGYILTSAYRTREDQVRIYQESASGLAQTPGCSEHETGLAFDVTVRREDGAAFESTPQYAWLEAHCHEYGFIQRYPIGKEDITGIQYEPWHYRYVGVEIARQIHLKNCTLEEYCAR